MVNSAADSPQFVMRSMRNTVQPGGNDNAGNRMANHCRQWIATRSADFS